MILEDLGSFLCGTEQPSLWIFDFSTAPRMLFYSYIPIIITSLFVGIFILYKDKWSLQAKLLFAFALSFVFWVLNILIQWVASYHAALMFSWQLTVIFELAIFLTALYFTYVFLYKEDIPNSLKISISIAGMVVAILIPSKLNVVAYDVENCEGIIGGLWQFIYALEPAIIVLAAYFCWARYRELKGNSPARQQVVIFGLGMIIFLSVFFFSNFYGEVTRVYEFNLWGPLGMVAFLTLLAYLIVRFRTFNIKVLATEALVWALWIMIGAIFFVAQTDATHIVTGITEVIAVFFGIMLIRSVRREVEQKELLAKLNAELGDKNSQLTDLNRQKSEFLRFASHDLKSPVGLIKQWASLIADGTYKDPAKVHETLEKIKATADRSIQSVDDLLDVNKIEENRMDYNFEVRDIISFVKGITEDYAPLAKAQKDIVVTFESSRQSSTPSSQLLVKMDTTRLRQVIQNLIGNSLKYTDPSASSGREKNWIKVILTEEQKSVLIAVKDSGLGMSKELLPILFEQFRRDPSVAKKIQGTGLGLYISKLFTVAHGGEIWAESEGKGLGSTFFVRLPKA